MTWLHLISFIVGYSAGMVITLALCLRRSNRYRGQRLPCLGDACAWRAGHDSSLPP